MNIKVLSFLSYLRDNMVFQFLVDIEYWITLPMDQKYKNRFYPMVSELNLKKNAVKFTFFVYVSLNSLSVNYNPPLDT